MSRSTSTPRLETIALIEAGLAGYHKKPRFFKRWYIDKGKPYFFVFKKNLDITNIQYAELLSLIVKYRTDKYKGSARLQFLTVQEFNATVSKAVGTFLPEKEPSPQAAATAYRRIAERYWDLFRNIVVIDPLFGSCAVYLPPDVGIELHRVCAASGYIHSCGRNVFMRNVAKARMVDLFADLKTYLRKRKKDAARRRGQVQNKPQKLFFALYSHEDFTLYDRERAADLRHGLDDLKLFVHKFHLGADSLVRVVDELRYRFRRHLVLPPAGDYRVKQSVEQRAQSNVDLSRTLWFLADRSIGDSSGRPGNSRYYICYEQQFINENPFHPLDENKPAWVEHTTIPHTLIGAMLNIAWMYAPPHGMVIADPFVGSGTTWLESLKFDELRAEVSDVAPYANLLAKDNLRFFALPAAGLSAVATELSRLIAFLRKMEPTMPVSLACAYKAVTARLAALEGSSVRKLGMKDVRWLEKESLLTRVIFYTALKANVRHSRAIERAQEKVEDAFITELDQLVRDIYVVREIRQRQELAVYGDECVILYPGKYSTACALSPNRLGKLAMKHCGEGQRTVVTCKDACKGLSKRQFDLIIADPPYGFNTEEDRDSLSALYRKMIPHFLLALKDGGQLILSLPELSRTGRPFLFFTQLEIVQHQIIVEARKLKMDVVATGTAGSRPEIARPPYYWESERALRRAILHFRFRTH